MIHWRPMLLVGMTILASPLALLALDPAAGPASLPPPASPLTAPAVDASLGGAVVRLFGAFTLVMALFLGGVWLWKHWQRTAGARGRWGRLQVLEARSLGNRQSIFVVGYENERLLLGSSPQGVTLLTRLPEAVEDLDRITPEAPPAGKFAEVLMGVLNSKR
jgi:flagellar protein FliO/FliZ